MLKELQKVLSNSSKGNAKVVNNNVNISIGGNAEQRVNVTYLNKPTIEDHGIGEANQQNEIPAEMTKYEQVDQK